MGDIILMSKQIDSMSELIEELRKGKSETVLLGQKAQQSKEFIMILVKNFYTNVELLRIGVVCEGHGLKTQYEINESNEIIIGFNKEVNLISPNSSDKVLRRELDSLFYEFKIIKNLNMILVVCETDIYCLNQRFEIVWNVFLDLIINHEITDEYVKVITDEETRVYSILNGCII